VTSGKTLPQHSLGPPPKTFRPDHPRRRPVRTLVVGREGCGSSGIRRSFRRSETEAETETETETETEAETETETETERPEKQGPTCAERSPDELERGAENTNARTRRGRLRSGRIVLGGGPRAANGSYTCCDAVGWAPPSVRPMLARRVADCTPRCASGVRPDLPHPSASRDGVEPVRRSRECWGRVLWEVSSDHAERSPDELERGAENTNARENRGRLRSGRIVLGGGPSEGCRRSRRTRAERSPDELERGAENTNARENRGRLSPGRIVLGGGPSECWGRVLWEVSTDHAERSPDELEQGAENTNARTGRGRLRSGRIVLGGGPSECWGRVFVKNPQRITPGSSGSSRRGPEGCSTSCWGSRRRTRSAGAARRSRAGRRSPCRCRTSGSRTGRR
jgi:hypothetical protein